METKCDMKSADKSTLHSLQEKQIAEIELSATVLGEAAQPYQCDHKSQPVAGDDVSKQ